MDNETLQYIQSLIVTSYAKIKEVKEEKNRMSKQQIESNINVALDWLERANNVIREYQKEKPSFASHIEIVQEENNFRG